MRRTLADVRAQLGLRGPMTVLVAVSGGADSMALLGLLERVRRADQLELVVGHVDHGLRASAAAEAQLVIASARARGHAHACTRLSLARGSGLPARARVQRRAALLEQAGAHGAQVIALGHTATDQAETVLLNLCRGSGPDGLAAMAPWEAWSLKPGAAPSRLDATGMWARPLLQLTREHARALALRLGLPFVDDPSNDALEHPRVRVRKRVLAELRALNPQVELRIATMARIMRLERTRGEPTAGLPSEHALAPLDAAALRSLPSGSRRAQVRALCLRGGVPVDALPERTIAAIDDAIARGLARRRWDLHRHVLHLADAQLWLARADVAHGGPDGEP
jgi:tRNA(Ile)-lysidine synthase